MLNYISFYLIFIIFISIFISLLVVKLHIPRPHIIIPVIIAVIVSPVILMYFYLLFFHSIPERIVPDLKGLDMDQAIKKLEAFKLKGRFEGTLYDVSMAEGLVVSQRPEAGRRVKEGRVVKLLTSSGSRKVTVPNLLGRPLLQAEAVLKAKGLRLGQVIEEQVKGPSGGLILTQNPLPGEEVLALTAINITVTASPEVIEEADADQADTAEEEISTEAFLKELDEESSGSKTQEVSNQEPKADSEQGGFKRWW